MPLEFVAIRAHPRAMLKSTALLTLLMIVLATSCYAADISDQRSNGSLNGRFWTHLNQHEKLTFVLGYCEGAPICPPQPTFSDIVKGIDRFYQEPENLRLTFASALRIFSLKVAGAKMSEIEAAMSLARQFADAVKEKK